MAWVVVDYHDDLFTYAPPMMRHLITQFLEN